MILSILILVLTLGILPMLTGLIPTFFINKSKRTVGVIFVCGFIYNLALFQLLAVPIVIAVPDGFGLLTILYSIFMALSAIAGITLMVFKRKKEGNILAETTMKRNLMKEEIVEWIMFAVAVLFQLFMFVRMTSFDGDDAYYVVQSLLTQQTDTLYRILPYTGLSTSLDLRHSLAVFPIWIAYHGKVSGIHTTVLCHQLIGLAIIPLVYMIYLEIGRVVLKKEKKKLPIFMIFIVIMQVFGNVSIYTGSTFFLTRTWQGKSMLANVCIPAIIWLFLMIFDSAEEDSDNRFGFWLSLFAINIVAAMCSTASVFLLAMLIGLTGLVLSFVEKNIQILLKLIITCLPLVVYGALFLLL